MVQENKITMKEYLNRQKELGNECIQCIYIPMSESKVKRMKRKLKKSGKNIPVKAINKHQPTISIKQWRLENENTKV